MSESNHEKLDSATRQPPAAAQPIRFSLRELFILTALVALVGGLYSWRSSHFEIALVFLPLSVVAVIVFVVYILTRSFAAVAIAFVVLIAMACLLVNPLDHGPQPARRAQCIHHLKQIGLALHNYHDTYGCLPPAHIADSKGNPIHSWRVLILPFMEQKSLYNRYSFNEPWDGPNNRKLHNEMVLAFCCPSRPDKQTKTDTSYVAVMGSQTMWPGPKATTLSDLIDGTSNTIMVVEVYNSGIHWMEPRDLHMIQMPLAVNPQQAQGISSAHPNVALAVFADGHTAALTSKTPPEIIRRLLTIADGEQIGEY